MALELRPRDARDLGPERSRRRRDRGPRAGRRERAAAIRRSRRIGATKRRRTRPSRHPCWRRSPWPSRLRPFARVERRAGGEEGFVGQRCRSARGRGGRIRRSRRAWRGAEGAGGGSATAGEARGSNGTSRTQRETDDFATPSSVAMSRVCGPRRAVHALSLLQLDFPAIPHAGSLPNVCSYCRRSATTLRGSRAGVASASGGAASRASSTRSGGCARA